MKCKGQFEKYNDSALAVCNAWSGRNETSIWKRTGIIVAQVRKRDQFYSDDPIHRRRCTYRFREGVFQWGAVKRGYPPNNYCQQLPGVCKSSVRNTCAHVHTPTSDAIIVSSIPPTITLQRLFWSREFAEFSLTHARDEKFRAFSRPSRREIPRRGREIVSHIGFSKVSICSHFRSIDVSIRPIVFH